MIQSGINKVISFYSHLWGFLQVLPSKTKSQFGICLALICFAAVAEMVTLAALLPFMTLILEPEKFSLLSSGNLMTSLIGGVDRDVLLTRLTICYLIWIIGSFSLSIFVTFYRTARIRDIKSYCVATLFSKYLQQDVAWHSTRNSASLIAVISEAATRGIDTSLQSLLILFSNVMLVVTITSALFYLEPSITLTAGSVLCIVFFLLHFIRERFFKVDGFTVTSLWARKIKIINEALGAIKEIKVYGLEEKLSGDIPETEQQLNELNRRIVLAGFLPRQIVEFLVLFFGVGGFLILVSAGHNPRDNLVGISLCVFALLRLFPPLNLIFVNLNQVRDNLGNLQKLTADLSLPPGDKPFTEQVDPVICHKSIHLQNIGFRYPDHSKPVLHNLNMTIHVGSRIGILGASGAGKSTLVDVILGLLQPDQGSIYIDGRLLTPRLRQRWAQSVGYVPQQMHLLDDSIRENIAFGDVTGEVNFDRVKIAAKQAEIANFIENLPGRYDTRVGERGVLLSGGQRQRLAIARALYRRPDLLIFDEATSALDPATEEAIMDSISQLPQSLTIIVIAHRVSTLKNCDLLYRINSGTISPYENFK